MSHEIREITVAADGRAQTFEAIATTNDGEIVSRGKYVVDDDGRVTVVLHAALYTDDTEELARLDSLPVEPLYWMIEQRLADQAN